MRKLSIYTPWLSRAGGGLQSSVRDLAIAIDNFDDVDVTTYGIKDNFFEEDIVFWKKSKVHARSYYGSESFRFSPGMILDVLNIKSDFIQLHGIWMCPSFAMRCSLFKSKHVPYMVSPHGMMDDWILSRNKWKKKFARFVWEDCVWNNASIFRALNFDEARSIKKIMPKKDVCIIPNGVNRLNDIDFESALKLKNENQPVLLFLGRLHEKKRVVELIEAWRLFKSRNRSNWKLEIAGWGADDYTNQVRNSVDSLKDLSIEFLGPVFGDNKHKVLSRASAFILPSLSEGLPVAVLEACAYGAIPLITDFCNLPELISEGLAHKIDSSINGIVIGMEKINEMNYSEISNIAQRSREYVGVNYNWDIIAKKFIEIQDWISFGSNKPNFIL